MNHHPHPADHRLAARLILPMVGLLVSPAWAISDALFEPAFAQFQQATHGQTGAIEPAATAFASLRAQEPGNPVLRAYAGAATALRANTTLLPWKKSAYAEEGLAQIDKALVLLTPAHQGALQRGVPATLEVQFVAANTFLAVPGFMNRGARGAQLLTEVGSSPLLASAPLAFRGEVWLQSAERARQDKRPDDARRFLQEVIDSKAPQAAGARAQLDALAS